MAKYTMARRNELARLAGFEGYRDRQERQRFYKATGDKSVLPDGFNASKLRTKVAAIPDRMPKVDSPLRVAMDRMKIKAGSVPTGPVEVSAHKSGRLRDAGNTNRSIQARAAANPDAKFQYTYVVKGAHGNEIKRTITKSGAAWADMLGDGYDIDDAMYDDMESEYGGSWAGSAGGATAGSFSMTG